MQEHTKSTSLKMKLFAVASSLFFLTACKDDTPKPLTTSTGVTMAQDESVLYTYKSEQACKAAGDFSSEECAKAFRDSWSDYTTSAPKYASREECEKVEDDCSSMAWGQPHTSGYGYSYGHHSHMPMIMPYFYSPFYSSSFITPQRATQFHPRYQGFTASRQSHTGGYTTSRPVYVRKGVGLTTSNGVSGLGYGRPMAAPESVMRRPMGGPAVRAQPADVSRNPWARPATQQSSSQQASAASQARPAAQTQAVGTAAPAQSAPVRATAPARSGMGGGARSCGGGGQ